MEGAKPYPRLREKSLYPLPHFGGGLGGEGKGQNFFGLYPAHDAVLDPLGQYRSFARARPCKNQESSVLFMVVQDGHTLVAVQTFQDAFGIHRLPLWNAAPRNLRLRDMEKGLGGFLVRNIRVAAQ